MSRRGGRRAAGLALLVLLAAAARPQPGGPSGADPGWVRWDSDVAASRVRLEPWGEPRVQALSLRLARANQRAVARLDSLYRAGAFGAAGASAARRAARRALARVALSAFDYVADMATADSCVRETRESELRRPFGRTVVNMGAFPYDRLARARVGHGRFRMDYDLVEGFRTTAEMMVGRRAEIRVERVRLHDAERPLLRMEYPSGAHGTLEMLFDSPYRGVVERRTVVDRGDTLDLVLVREIEGVYVRKWGIHRLGGLATWRGRAPGAARVGAAAYFPAIKLRLPWFLPDLGLADLREFHVPHPVWERDFVRDPRRHPEWLGLDPTGAMTDWESEGPRPRLLDEVFPDR